MAQPAQVVSGGGGIWLPSFIFIPALIPPGYLVYEAWTAMSVMGWHVVFKLLASGGIIAAIIYGLGLIYRYTPMFFSIGVTVLYMTATYGWFAVRLQADQIWTAAVAVAAGLLGFFGGRALAREQHRDAD